MQKKIELFVPGRLCILGEHSDWAGRYRTINNKITKGYAIVTGIEEGIYANAVASDKLIVKDNKNKIVFESDMDYAKLKKIAEKGEYWSYVAGVAACVKEQYNVSGIELTITKVTLPEKKGLSSSAAICVLVTRAFNKIYNLHLNNMGEMNLAYLGEITTPSRCGRLDQACAFGKNPILMIFDGDRIEVKSIKVQQPLYFVFADLMSKKNTIKILGDLNRSYPFPETDIDKNVHQCLGKDNEDIVLKSIEYIENGELEEFGKMMNLSQENFDKKLCPACPSELSSPVLHKVINDGFIKTNSFGAKGVGSQGDGSVQILAKDYDAQQRIKKYLKKNLGMDSYELTIESTETVKKAIIPVAGNGTRMYPITKCVKKAFLPIIDSDGIVKPVILCLLEEIVDAGIEEICLIIDRADKKDYDKFFKTPLQVDVASKLSPELLEYETKIQKIGKKIKYIYQEEKLGLGHAVSLCDKFADGDPVLLVLGDQLYKSNSDMSCTEQFLKFYSKTGKLSVSVCKVEQSEVSRYGILCGTVEKNDNYFAVDKMVEKPEKSIAEEKYYTKVNGEKEYYAVFGEYILTESVFDVLKQHIKNNQKENGEFQLTSALDEARKTSGMFAYIPNGKMLDVGNVLSYKETFIEKSK